MNEQERQELVDEAALLRSEGDALLDEVEVIKQVGMRNRLVVRVLAGSLVLDLLLTAGLVWNAARTQSAVEQAAQARREVAYEACVATNEVRATDKKLWEFILLHPREDQPPPDPEVLKMFREILKGFDLQDCGSL